jgi:hypothetical protein
VDREQVALKAVKTQKESNFKGNQEAQRDSQAFSWNQPSGPNGREASSKTAKMVSWVEMAIQEVQRQKASRSRVSSKMGSCQIVGFA